VKICPNLYPNLDVVQYASREEKHVSAGFVNKQPKLWYGMMISRKAPKMFDSDTLMTLFIVAISFIFGFFEGRRK
jgi:hypothetical protein